jgi:hypothetical protein
MATAGCAASVVSLNGIRAMTSLNLVRSVVSLVPVRGMTAICGDDAAPDPDVETASVIFDWEAAEGEVEEYIVEVGTASGLSDVGRFHTGSAETSYLLTLDSGTYFARAIAVVDGVEGDPSDEDTFTI